MARTTRRGPSRPSTYKKRPPGLDDRYTCNMALNIVARKVEVIKAHNESTLPYGTISDMVDQMKSTLPWLTKDMLRSHIKKLKKTEPTPSTEGDALGGLEGATSRTNSSTLSPLTLDSGLQPTGDNRRSGTGTCSSGESAAPARTEPTDKDAAVLLVAGGRPKGSTLKSQRDVKNREQLATYEAARVYKDTIDERRKDKVLTRLRNGDLSTIIAHAKAKYKVDDHCKISAATIRSRYKRDNLNPSTPQGTPSPMAAVEPYASQGGFW